MTIRRLSRGRDDDGVALIAVIGIMAVLSIIAVSIATGAVSSATFTSSTKADVEARAAADAGIDTAWSGMTHGTFYCTVPAAAGMDYETTVSYFNDAGDELPCSGPSGLIGTPVKAVVASTGKAARAAIGSGAAGSQRTVAALFDILVDPGTFALDQAVFSQGGFALTNAFHVLDASGRREANIYSNGTISCGANTPTVQGWILAQGDFIGNNTCSIDGSVWVGGKVDASAEVSITGDLFSAGGTGPSPSGVDLGKIFVGGTVVANGDVKTTTADNKLCSSGSFARVCGSIISIDGGVDLSSSAVVGGGIYAHDDIDLGNSGSGGRRVGGNVVSSHGGLVGKASTGTTVGGYVAVMGPSKVPKVKIGNPSSSCAAESGFSLCNPANPVYPIADVPPVLNFPTNTRVVAPPRESMPRVNMYPDAGLALKWPGWSIRHVPCGAVKSTVAVGWTGKLLIIADGCTSPITWDKTTSGDSPITLHGDLAIMNPSGFATSSDVKVKSAAPGTKRSMLWIVPSDAKMANGTDLATWGTPIVSDPTYTAPTCNSGSFGSVNIGNKFDLVDTKMFVYTPCGTSIGQHLTGFEGQVYSGSTALPSDSVIQFAKMAVPGATAGTPPPILVDVTPTARFDVRDTP